ncbi:heme exporter protein CcmD [Nitrosomonas sp. HPC101]|nr:heme exporter protein CcmD [Nitrosomonas sp. HPC101]MXS85967.1 heme exporter protein CcmD [Nitrosomonas sp. HPC101]
MKWESVSDFFAMGGYGLYVWGSYLVAMLCVIGEIVLLRGRKRTLYKHLGQKRRSNLRGEK